MIEVDAYYKQMFGAPEREAKYVTNDDIIIRVFKWNQEQCDLGVNLYATLGASNILGTQQESCEFFIGLEPSADEVVEALAEVALDGIGSNSIPYSGDSITLAFNLWEGTNMQTLLFGSGEDIFPSLEIGSKVIRFIKLIPLYKSELDFKKENGEEEMWKRFKELFVPFWDPNRKEMF